MMLNNLVDYRQKTESSHQWIDVSFNELVSDPKKVIAEVYTHLGWEFTLERDTMRTEWIEEDNVRRKKEVRVTSNLNDFYLDEDKIKQVFSRYYELFGPYLKG